VDERLVSCADRMALVRAIQELSPGYRTIFILHQVKGYEHKEIAERLHCSIGNSKSQLHKAKARLRELLAPQGYTFRQRAAARKASAVRTPVLMKTSALHLVQPSTDASPESGNRPCVSNGNKPQGMPQGMLPRLVAASAYKKPASRDEGLANLSLACNPEIMLPAVLRSDAGLIAESAS
jgi:hypothetical protein